MAKALEIEGLRADEPYYEAAARVVGIRAQELFAEAEGVLDVSDIERVHDMRVATRRLRAVLEIFEPCFPSKAFKLVLGDVKMLADALGERRDPDVHIESLTRYLATATQADAVGVNTLIVALGTQQSEANLLLADSLKQIEESGLRTRLEDLVGGAK